MKMGRVTSKIDTRFFYTFMNRYYQCYFIGL